jgi:hypothetical protein
MIRSTRRTQRESLVERRLEVLLFDLVLKTPTPN